MRTIFITAFLLFPFIPVFSQDIIVLKDGGRLEVRDIEITPDSLKYRLTDSASAPVHVIAANKVYIVRFENGREEVFAPDPLKHESYFANNNNDYYSLGLGFGRSFGGAGLRFQRRMGKVRGFGFHAGFGYSVSDLFVDYDGWLGSAGVKFFWHKGWYVDLLYGPVENEYIYTNGIKITRAAWGPSVLIGGDFPVSKSIGFNFAMGQSYNITQPTDDPEYHFAKKYYLLEIGSFIKF